MMKRACNFILCIMLLYCSHSARGQEKTLTNSIGMELILIQPGKMTIGKFHPPYPVPDDTVKGHKQDMIMWMGDGRTYSEAEFTLAKALATHDAMAGFEVQIKRAFYIGKFEVTQGQWKQVMGKNPSVFQKDKVEEEDRRPVESITWQDVQDFVAKLNDLEKSRKYRLPTEFEWEYAARAGAGDDILWSEIQLSAQLGTPTTQVVGKKKPNNWGLYDMLGNVWEWVQDYYNEKIFADSRPPDHGTEHVLKGASFVGDVKNATWLTHAAGPGNGWDVGFRLVMEVPDK